MLYEDVVPTPKGPYGESKIEAEEYILDFLEGQGVTRQQMCSRVPESLELKGESLEGGENDSLSSKPSTFNSKRVYIFRPCMIHGPGNKGNLNLLYGVVKRGIPWPLGAYENRRTFTSVGNVCFAVSGVLGGDERLRINDERLGINDKQVRDVPSGIYNLGDDDALSTNELIGVICEALGKRARIWRIPQALMNAVATLGGWLHLPLNPLRMQKLTENYVSSNAKIKQALDIDRFPIGAREGLRETIEWFREHDE